MRKKCLKWKFKKKIKISKCVKKWHKCVKKWHKCVIKWHKCVKKILTQLCQIFFWHICVNFFLTRFFRKNNKFVSKNDTNMSNFFGKKIVSKFFWHRCVNFFCVKIWHICVKKWHICVKIWHKCVKFIFDTNVSKKCLSPTRHDGASLIS